jgi:hypothetical protein
MEREIIKLLVQKLQQLQPQLGTTKQYTKWVNKYVDTMLIAIKQAITAKVDKSQLKENEFSFPKHKVSLAMGRYGNPQNYIYPLMQQHNETSLLLEVRDGFSYPNNSQLTVMRFNPIYEDLLMEELLNLKLEKNQQLMDDIELNYTHIINVDIASLRGYINKTKQDIAERKNGQRYNEVLLRNLSAAQQLMTMTHEADDRNPHSAYLLERYKTDDCGRIYGEGCSLQRMRKEVRDAALGVCHKYDFKACAFAVMASLAHTINPNLKIGAVLDYIKNRAKIRVRIAADTGIDEKLIKSIFSAVGFGAKLRNTHFSAIRRELAKHARQQHDSSVWLEKNAWNHLGNDEYERLVANQTFTYIYEDFQQINATILQHYGDKELVINGFVYSNIDPNAQKLDKNGKRKKKSDYRTNEQKLAWIYQACETLAREQFEQLSGQKALLTTHDCIYFKQKLPASAILNITDELQQTFPYLRFEYEPIYPITDKQTYDSRFAEADEYERQHKALIAAKSIEHKDYESIYGYNEKFLKPQDVKTEYDYEVARREQIMRDVGITEYNVGSSAAIADLCDDEDEYWEPAAERQYWSEAVVD